MSIPENLSFPSLNERTSFQTTSRSFSSSTNETESSRKIIKANNKILIKQVEQSLPRREIQLFTSDHSLENQYLIEMESEFNYLLRMRLY